jgi:hypothetical protein
MKVNKFRIQAGDKNLILEQEFDENNNCIVSIDNEHGYAIEKQCKFNKDSLIIEEREIEDDIETSCVKLEYDESNKVNNEKNFIGGELYYEIKYTNSDTGRTIERFEEGICVEKTLYQMEGDGKQSISFFEEDVLTRKEDIIEDKESNTKKVSSYDGDNTLLYTSLEERDTNGQLVLHEVKDGKNLLQSVQYEYEKELKVKETLLSYGGENTQTVAIFEYDDRKNLVKKEERDLSGNLKLAQFFQYDEKGRVTQENILQVGSFDAVFGTGKQGGEFEYVYEYEE